MARSRLIPAVLAFALAAVSGALPAQDLAAPSARPNLSKVAVLVFPSTPMAERSVNSAQSRIEQILLDNGIETIDREKSEELKDVWKQLEDPGYFVTADDFVAQADKYQIDGIVRLYLSADAAESFAGFYTATAQADIRFVDESAKVDAKTSVPMGAPGQPPSDGLTQQAALLNAVQRAVDNAAQLFGLQLSDPASPRAVALSLEGPVAVAAPLAPNGVMPPLDADALTIPKLFAERWNSETATCSSKAPGGELGAVGGSITETPRGDRFNHYGSRIHLVDLAQRREIAVFETQKVGRKEREQRGTSSLLACSFVSSWRYLAATTGDYLSLWDTERGLKMAQVLLPFGLQREARIELLRDASGAYLQVSGEGGQTAAYKLAVNRGGPGS